MKLRTERLVVLRRRWRGTMLSHQQAICCASHVLHRLTKEQFS